jgi:hypothetical protein
VNCNNVKSSIDNENSPETEVLGLINVGTPERIRTPNLLIRSKWDESCNSHINNKFIKTSKVQRAPKRAQVQKIEPELLKLINNWQSLPPHIKEAIKALLKTAIDIDDNV